ncbi:MAG: cell division protein FtsW [Candidatus Liptonbacteria bacterium]|nr:cell division protein FtsW [Candidatus Liptonbacteria bacterium]
MLGVKTKTGHSPDYLLLAVIFILTIFGLVMLSSASSELGKIRFNDSYYYLKHQVISGLLIGLIGFFVAYKFYYPNYKKLALPLLIISLGLLTLVFTKLGVTAGGATRWIRLGPTAFQPAELLKITFILYLAAWLSNAKIQRGKSLAQGFLPFLIVSGVMAVLLILQPATSMVVLLITAGLVVYFLSGAKLKYLGFLGLIGVVALSIIIYLTPYRFERVATFLKSGRDTRGAGYHLNEALIAIGSGGLTGVGFGDSRTKTNYLPAPIDDSIFAVAAEELGFIGAGSLIVVFGFFVFRLFWISRKIRDQFGRLLLIGFASIIAIQSLVNIAAISGILPLTGLPLPFVSYGGTALAIFLTMSGIAANVSKYTS